MKKSKRQLVEVQGGPWKDKKVLLPMAGTMVFSVNGWHGRYDMHGDWHNV